MVREQFAVEFHIQLATGWQYKYLLYKLWWSCALWSIYGNEKTN